MIKKNILLLLCIYSHLVCMEKKPDMIFFGLRNVLLKVDAGAAASLAKSLCNLSPESIERDLFNKLNSLEFEMECKTKGNYPALIKAWLIDHISCDEAKAKALEHIHWYVHPILYQAANIAFDPERSALAFRPVDRAAQLIAVCQAKKLPLAICTNWNTESFKALLAHHANILEQFPQKHVSGNLGILASDPHFFRQITEGRNAHECIFVDVEDQTLMAAQRAGLRTIDCSEIGPAKALIQHGLLETSDFE